MVCSLSWQKVSAQCATIFKPLEERLEESAVVVEGKVIEKEAFWGKHLIYTKNLIEIYKVFKGETTQEYLEVVTTGGEIGDIVIMAYPSLDLKIGQTGIFMLKAYQGKAIDNSKNILLRPVADSYSKIAYKNNNTTAQDGTEAYADLANLYSRIRAKTGSFVAVKALPQPSTSRSPLAPSITSFSPSSLNGGKGEVLTIEGSGFGNTIGTVNFKDADDGGTSKLAADGSQIVLWSDTEIQVQVPSVAGTGVVEVITNGGESVSTITTLEVTYSQINVPNSGVIYEPQLIDEGGTDDAGDGGYYFNYSTSTSNNGVDITSISGATAAIERAAATWQAATGLPVYVGDACGTSTVQLPGAALGDDDVNLIAFDNDLWDLDVQASTSTLAVVYSTYSRCPLAGYGMEVVDIDMFIRRDGTSGYSWEYGPGTPSGGDHDFETIVLHEFGHVSQLAHVISPGAVMHYAINPNTSNRSLSANDINGGNYVMTHSLAYNGGTDCVGGDFPEARQVQSYSAAQECSVLLPVELTYFTGEKVGTAVQLKWETASELNNDFFTVERSSDGRNFEVLSTIRGAGTVDYTLNYSFLDEQPLLGTNYYRLWQTDFDGTKEALGLIVLTFDLKNQLTIFPNPIQANKLDIDIQSVESFQTNLSVQSISGQIVWESTYIIDKGKQQLRIELPKLPSGLYILQLGHLNFNRQHRFVIP